MTRSYVTPVPPTPRQRLIAAVITAHLAAGAVLALVLMICRGVAEMRGPSNADLSAFGTASLMATITIGCAAAIVAFLAVLVAITWAIDYAYRWLRWALTGVWVVRSEDIDEIESA